MQIGRNRKHLDYVKISKAVMRMLLLAAASFFMCLLVDAQKAEYIKKLSICLQSNKNEEGCYLFLPSFATLSNVSIRISGGHDGEGIVLEEKASGSVLVEAGDEIVEAEVMRSGNMPCLWVETNVALEELQTDKAIESAGKLTLFLPSGRVAFQGEIEAMHGHGNSTWYENKKSWQIKLAEKASLFQMKPAKEWLLISNVKDLSMMRNKLFLDMAKDCGLPGALSSEWADLYVNGEYQGLYLLTEKVDIAPGRLEIGNLEAENKALNGDVASYMNYTIAAENGTLLQGWVLPENPENIAGGYLLEIEYPERYAAEPSKFLMRNGQSVVVKSPAYASVEQITYIHGFVQDFESALYAGDGRLPQEEALDVSRAGGAYTEWMDMDSFVGRYVLDEISKNIDANYSSVFFYKPRYENKLYAGPIWDYDLALGNSGGWGEANALHDPKGFYVNQTGWSKALYERPEFFDAVKECYQKRYSRWLEKFLEQEFDAYKEYIKEAAKMDNCYRGIDTWEEDTEKMRSFLKERKAWLDEQWGE